MSRRSGATLIEVLVSIFVMGIGLLALLTLFPLGVILMAQAVRDDRCGHAGVNGQAVADALNVRDDPLLKSIAKDPDSGGVPIPDVFVNPDPTKLPNADPYRESYPIFADPIGYHSVPALPGSSLDWVGGYAARGFLRRRPVSFATKKLDILNSFALTDDISFDKKTSPGAPQKVANSISRDSRFSWAYLLRRPQTRDTSVVDCTVVVFENRPLSLTGKLSLSEHFFPSAAGESVLFDRTTNMITLTSALPPPIRPGNWIYDATRIGNDVQSCFYRVVAVNELPGNQTRYEVQQPIRPLRSAPKATTYQGMMIVMEGIIGVFEKGPAIAP